MIKWLEIKFRLILVSSVKTSEGNYKVNRLIFKNTMCFGNKRLIQINHINAVVIVWLTHIDKFLIC